MKKTLLIVVAILLPLLAFVSDLQGKELKENAIRLNEAGEGTKEVRLTLEGEDILPKQEIVLDLPERRLTKEECAAYFSRAKEEIDQTFFQGEDTALSVRKELNPRESYCNGMVTASWRLGNYRYFDDSGARTGLEIPEEGEDLYVEAELICQEEKETYSFFIHVYPVEETEAEKLLKATLITIKLQEEEPGREKVLLPSMENGVKLQWKEDFPHSGAKVILLEVLALTAYPLLRHRKRQEEEEKRVKSLLLEYPNLVNKLSILVSCGMSIKQSWYKISACNSDKEQKDGKSVYDYMAFTMRELESGASERQAYQSFADRIHVQPYYRLSRILIQDLEKGGGGLKEQLQHETEEAFKERKLLAKKLGEEADTKMIGPLIMMMGIVMAIVIAPAIIGFSI